MRKVEYRVRPVERYIVTRFESEDRGDGTESGACETRGEYDNAYTAFEVATALCKAEHQILGYPIGDERIQYPRHPDERTAERA